MEHITYSSSCICTLYTIQKACKTRHTVMRSNEDAMSNEVASITPKSYLQEDSTLMKMNLEKK